MAVQEEFRLRFTAVGQFSDGAVLSTLFTVKVQFALFEDPSVAVIVTVVAPVPLRLEPAAGDWVTVRPVAQLSVAFVGPE